MSRPTTKQELIDKSNEAFAGLFAEIKTIPNKYCITSQICSKSTAKDLLSHLHEWHNMLFIWYDEGMKGEKPQMPSPGYSWKETPKLNQKIYKEYKNMDLEEIISRIKSTHKQILKIIETHTDKELFTKKKYDWTGSTSMGTYFTSAASSHYEWAVRIIRKAKRKGLN